MAKRYKAAAVQFEPTMFRKDENVSSLLALVEKAAKDGAKLIVTPEMGTTGYCWVDRDEVAPFVENIPGPTTDRFSEVARRYGCHVVIGMPERDPETNLYYNSAALIGPEGFIGRHRKTHPYISEPKWAAPGDCGHAVFETSLGRIAILICMDLHFAETARHVALEGADVICHTSNWLAERTPAPYWMSRAFENSCWLIESNRWGLERTVQFSGGSCVIAPDGSIAAVIDSGDGVAYAEIDLAASRARRVLGEPTFEDRRPEMYMNVATNTFAWNPSDFFKLYGHSPIPPGRRSHVGVAQFAPERDVARNLATIEAMADEAAGRGVDLLVLPELCLTGGPAAKADLAERLSGPAVARLIEIATQRRMHIVAGLAERGDGVFHDTVALVGPEGLVGSYRSVHLTAATRSWATAGDRWEVFDLPEGRIGLLTGYDASFPEAGRSLALLGCDVIAVSAAQRGAFVRGHGGTAVRQNYPIPTGPDPWHWHHFRVRAGENNVYLAFANIFDAEQGFDGKSGVFGPDTFAFPRCEAVQQRGAGVAAMEIDTTSSGPYPSSVVRRKDLVLMRLPHLYKKLIEKPRGAPA
ncbi:amidohydrolase [Hansschlegelia plantiphila]|uniref:Amidohydrolase n=1 Tax=Hansschlegelia plantiphila TaxID=374655 RepID=A0A9W6MV60_9HYPH|nr:amidohydrolase [Hansschlegelia plantiphila]